MIADQRLLRWFLVTFGLVCVGIVLAHIVFGPSPSPDLVLRDSEGPPRL
jgi:hypothetical protein